jgi:hypothetical protein
MKTLSGLAKEFRVDTHSSAAVRKIFLFMAVLASTWLIRAA